MSPNSTAPTVAVPGGVVEGDTLVLVARRRAPSAPTVTNPAGWTLIHAAVGSTAAEIQTYLWTKRPGPVTPGPTWSSPEPDRRPTLQVLAYRAASGIESFVQAFDTMQRLDNDARR